MKATAARLAARLAEQAARFDEAGSAGSGSEGPEVAAGGPRASKRLRGESAGIGAGGDQYPHKDAWYSDVQDDPSVKGKDVVSGDDEVALSVVVLDSESDSDDSEGEEGARPAKKKKTKHMLARDPGPASKPAGAPATSTERWHTYIERKDTRAITSLANQGLVQDIRKAFGKVAPERPAGAGAGAAAPGAVAAAVPRLLHADLEADHELFGALLKAVADSKKATAAGGARQAARYLACHAYLKHVRDGKGLVGASEAAAKEIYPAETKSGRKTGTRIRDWLCTFKAEGAVPLPKVHAYPMAFRNLIFDDEIRDLCMEEIGHLNGTGARKKKWAASAFMLRVVDRLHAERPGLLPPTKSISTKTISFWLRELGMELKDNQKGLYKVLPRPICPLARRASILIALPAVTAPRAQDVHEREDVVARRHEYLLYSRGQMTRVRPFSKELLCGTDCAECGGKGCISLNDEWGYGDGDRVDGGTLNGRLTREVVRCYHDETCCDPKEGLRQYWGEKGDHLYAKAKGGGLVMVSGVICPCHGHMTIPAEDMEPFLTFCANRAAKLGVPVPDFHLSLIPADKKSKAEIKKLWMNVTTPGGVPYYWNVHTGQTCWNFDKIAEDTRPDEADIKDARGDTAHQYRALRELGGGQGFWSFTTMKPGKNRDG